MVNVRLINLSENKIRRIEAETFDELIRLSQLKLSNNPLKSVDKEKLEKKLSEHVKIYF